jgi:hypothetical protein
VSCVSCVVRISLIMSTESQHDTDEEHRETTQRNAIMAWINSVLTKYRHPLVKNLVADISTGLPLYQLLKAIAGKKYLCE